MSKESPQGGQQKGPSELLQMGLLG